MDRDSGNMYVLEAIMISMILLGAAYAVHTLQYSSLPNARPRAELQRLVDDALTLFDGLSDGNGTKVMDLYVLEALHCATDAAASANDCQSRRSNNLSLKLESYLPAGAGYAIFVGNSAASREIYRSPLPSSEIVAASRTFVPEWNTTLVFTEFSCYPAGVDANATLVPLDHARLSWARWGNVTTGLAEYAGERAATAKWWNATLLSATRPAASDIHANVTGNATFPGTGTYGFCDHGGKTASLRTALQSASFTALAPSLAVGSNVTFRADVSAIAALAGVTVNSANVTLYAPLPPRAGAADTWVREGDVLTLTGADPRTGVWRAPSESFYGTHVALLRVKVTVGGTPFELRRATTLDVALPTGEVPVDPPYRAALQAWLPDWR